MALLLGGSVCRRSTLDQDRRRGDRAPGCPL